LDQKLADKIRSTFQPKQLPPTPNLPFSFEFKEVDEDLNSLSQWLNNNLITLNYEKTKFMIFASKRQPTLVSNVDINIQSKKLLRETSLKYLGITLSCGLTWNEHIENITGKINQRLGVLRRIKEYLDMYTHQVLYTALILPFFYYGDMIWGNKNNAVLMNSMQVLQNKAAKLILDKHP
jgi:hypothetical protein